MTDHNLWQDREIRFDIPEEQKDLIRGEFNVSVSDNIEDFKGNAGERGILMINNLRMIWYQRN